MNLTNPNLSTCVLYFTTGKSGHKSFSSKKKRTSNVQKLLFTKTLAEIRKTKLDYQISNGKAFGKDFLERLNGAVADIFNSGYEKVIVIGDDTPDLSWTLIKLAENNLANQKLSIGPSKDGGVYLMAFNQKDYGSGILKNLTWHSSKFKDELLENILSEKIDYEQLTELEDLDSAYNLTLYLSKNCTSTFFKILKNIFYTVQQNIQNILFYSFESSEYSFDRGPPKIRLILFN